MGITSVFMGTPDTAIPILKALNDISDIKLVVTQPDRPKGRKRRLQPTPVKEEALNLGLEVIQPEKVRKNEEFEALLREIKPDVAVVVAYGRILPESVLEIPVAGCVNIHFSLLPEYRGAAPVNWALVNGELTTGVTMMKMDAGLDTGPVIAVKSRNVLSEDNTQVLLEKLAIDGADLLKTHLENYVSGKLSPVAQNNEKATYAPLMKKEDGKIDFNKPADRIFNMVRGFNPWPSAYSAIKGKTFKIIEAEETGLIEEDCKPGKVMFMKKNVYVVCKNGELLKLKKVQPESKKAMDAVSCINGGYLSHGDCFE